VVPGFEAPADAPAGAPDRICRTMLMHSDDGGATWSAPREVTRSVKRDAPVTSTATGPGIGIQLRRGDAKHRGRVLMPFNQGPFDRWRVYAAISDDGGDTWRMGACAPDDERGIANEVQMFERADGAVVLNARQHLGAHRRKAAASVDGGETWSRLADVPELPDPQCMGGVLSLDGTTVVFTGCDSESRRALGTMWISRDGGATWPEKVLFEPKGFAYSVPVALDAGKVGVLYETAGYKSIVFAPVSLPSAAATPAAR
jgi:sialidase-1